MEKAEFETICRKLDAIVALLAMDKLSDKPKKDSILLLKQFGLDNQLIATIVGTTPGSVAVRLSESKKAKA